MPVCEPSGVEARLEIGGYDPSGVVSPWRPWNPESTTFIQGVQDGFHIFLPLRYQGLCDGPVQLAISVNDPEGTQIIEPYDFQARSKKTDEWSTLTFTFILCPSRTNLVDRAVHLAVEVGDEIGQSASAEGDTVLRCNDGDVKCNAQCGGPQ